MTTTTRHHRASAQRRRAALLDATRELLGEIGAGAITHRAVAKRAGVPLSTTSYFFGSIDELIAEAIREQRHEQIRSFDQAERTWILQDDDPAVDILSRIAEQLTERTTTQKAANVETYLAAARNPEIAETLTAVVTRFEERLAALRSEPESDDAQAMARSLLALALGSSLHDIAGLDAPADSLARGFEFLLAGALLTEQQRATLFARLDARRGQPTPTDN